MKPIVFLIGALLMSARAWAELPPEVSRALKIAEIPETSVAVYVQSVGDEAIVLSHNADQSMNPASVMKLVTTNAALELLTPAYRWKTELYRHGSVENGVLQGDLIIKGYGDPSFKTQDFTWMLTRLQQAGIRSVQGDLVLDKVYFESNIDKPDFFDDDIWRSYNAMPSAFLVNARSTSFRFEVIDNVPTVHQEFELPEIKIINQLKLADNGCGAWRNHLKYEVQASETAAMVTFSGTLPTGCGEKYLELSLFNDDRYAYFIFKKLWKSLDGGFKGQLKVAETPDAAVKLLEHHSESLGYVVRDINKWSHNLMARQLLLTIAAERMGAPASVQKGDDAIRQWLRAKDLRFNELVVDNGSGLSRKARISAEHLGQMLVKAFSEATMPEFVASLPILSKDGTVMGRLRDTKSSGRAHLKTGSLNGVSAIAGYVVDSKGRRQVVVMLVNHANAAESRPAQDALVAWVGAQL
ncbi:MAG: D-alanyl-D-alanine carboxypeptidase/D-alanyl-D-alanine-endopeptidase [Betaproteobacteria bacterium]|nr:D-alanyl-D-alanine carboxypeptidase/D-alanyl-D-alanine-endopeptidase [Betaproteobacteria bacterium]